MNRHAFKYSMFILLLSPCFVYADQNCVKAASLLTKANNAENLNEELLKESISLCPSFAEAYNNLAVLYYNNLNFEKALQNTNKAIELKEDKNFFLTRASIFLKKGNLHNSNLDFEYVLSKEPKNIKALEGIGIVNFKENNIASAITFIDKALVIEPENIDLLINKSIFLNMQNEDIEFEKVVKKILRIDPKNQTAQIMLTKILEGKKNFHEAEIYINQILKNNPKSLKLLQIKASILQKTDNYDQLEKLYLNILSLEPTNSINVLNLAKVYLLKNNFEKIQNLFDENNSGLEKDADYFFIKSIVLFRTGKFHEAINAMLQSLEINSSNSDAVYNLSLMYKKINDSVKADYYQSKFDLR